MQNILPDHNQPLFLSTAQQPAHLRHEWLQDTIAQEYAHVSVSSNRDTPLFNEMRIYPWQHLRLSAIRSNGITIQRSPGECNKISQDAYFAVILLSGQYLLEQNGREVFLQPGEMALYDATRPHRIHSPGPFSKLIVSIPRTLLRSHLAGVEHCTARHIPAQGIAAIGSSFIQAAAQQSDQIDTQTFHHLAPQALDMLAQAIACARPSGIKIGRSRSTSLHRVKQFVETHLHEHELDTRLVAAATGLSARYINDLFTDDDISLMRYIWQRRLEKCRQALLHPAQQEQGIAQISYQWGFIDQAHFSRSFKQAFGTSPRAYRTQQAAG